MSKAVLIMDMPECCWRCKLARKVADNDWDRVCLPSGTYMEFAPVMMTGRPSWCPLREAPEKKNYAILSDKGPLNAWGNG